ncbi:MAG: hypothetical protein HC838_08740 [Spirulinaceae cyanobacterium RM2_2_10]|nr:hypothetical protein [Spirulinaceae cyanobacterium RM2_2_10]
MRSLRWQPFLTWRSLQERLTLEPAAVPEESLSLRLLTQLVVSIGIIAVDVTASTRLSVWALPLSAIGGVWSWLRRRQHNVAAKFLIAIGMLALWCSSSATS